MSSATTETCRLILDARLGKAESLGKLLQTHLNYLRLMARAHLDTKLQGRTSPSDVVQETLLEAHRDFSRFRGTNADEFAAWLRTILVNNLRQLVRRHVMTQKRDVRREISIDDAGASLERSTARLVSVLAANGPSPSHDAVQHETSLVLADELESLPDDYREVIILRHLEGLDFPEVAERMERSHGAVRMLWMRAINELRTRFKVRGVL